MAPPARQRWLPVAAAIRPAAGAVAFEPARIPLVFAGCCANVSATFGSIRRIPGKLLHECRSGPRFALTAQLSGFAS